MQLQTKPYVYRLLSNYFMNLQAQAILLLNKLAQENAKKVEALLESWALNMPKNKEIKP